MLCPHCLDDVARFDPWTAPDGQRWLRCPACVNNPVTKNRNVPLAYEKEYATYPAVPYSLMGLTGHGKTRYVDGLLRELERIGTKWRGCVPLWLDEQKIQEVRDRLDAFRAGAVPDPSQADFPEPQVVRLTKVPRVGGCQLVLYDTAGEVFDSSAQITRFGWYVLKSPAVVWLASLMEPREYGLPPEPVPEADLTRLMTSYTQAMTTWDRPTKHQTVVLTLTKAERLFDLPNFPASARRLAAATLPDGTPGHDLLDPAGDPWGALEAASADLETWLLGAGYHNLVNGLTHHFGRVRYCAVSAQGGEAENTDGFLPRGVLGPLFWLWRGDQPALWVEAGGVRRLYLSVTEALADTPPAARVVLGPETYRLRDTVYLRKPVTLVGAGRGKTVLASAAAEYAIGVSTEGTVTLTDLDVTHDGPAAADVVRVVNGVFAAERVGVAGGRASKEASIRGAGVAIGKEGGAALTECVLLRNSGPGVFVGTARPFSARGCRAESNGTGFHFTGAARVEMTGCSAIGNLGGVLLTGTAQCSVSGGEFNGNKSFGLAATQSARLLVAGIGCTGNGQVGVRFEGQAGGRVEAARCVNTTCGVHAQDESVVTVQGTECSLNQEAGVRFVGRACGDCTGTRFLQNAVGLVVDDQAEPRCEALEFSENREADVTIAVTVPRAYKPDVPSGTRVQDARRRRGIWPF